MIWDAEERNKISAGSVATNPDATRSAINPQGRLSFRNLETGADFPADETPQVPRRIGFDFVGPIAFSPTGETLAAAFGKNSVKLFDVASRNEIRMFVGDERGVRSITFSPDGKVLVSLRIPAGMKAWDVATGKERRLFKETKVGVNEAATRRGATDVRFRPEGDFPATSLAFSPDGQIIATAETFSATLWDAATGARIRSLRPTSDVVRVVAFSPDGRTLATAGNGGSITLWEDLTEAQMRTIDGHAAEVESVSFSPNGRRLVTSSSDGITKLWDVESGAELFSIQDLSDSQRGAFFSADGRWLVVSGLNSTRFLDSHVIEPNRKMGLFLAREVARMHPLRDDAIRVVQHHADWNEAVRAAAQDFVRINTTDAAKGPVVAGALKQEGFELIASRKWRDSADVFAKAIAANPGDVKNMALCARLRLAAEDRDGYRAMCRELLAKFGDSRDWKTIVEVGVACVAGEGAVEDPTRLIELARRGLDLADHSDKVRFWNLLGAAQFRAGQFNEACETLKQNQSVYILLALDQLGTSVQSYCDCLASLTSTYQALGQVGEARKTRVSLEKAISLFQDRELRGEFGAEIGLSIVLARQTVAHNPAPEEATAK
jgi:tetratricopeptide (TPR) repeat protein